MNNDQQQLTKALFKIVAEKLEAMKKCVQVLDPTYITVEHVLYIPIHLDGMWTDILHTFSLMGGELVLRSSIPNVCEGVNQDKPTDDTIEVVEILRGVLVLLDYSIMLLRNLEYDNVKEITEQLVQLHKNFVKLTSEIHLNRMN